MRVSKVFCFFFYSNIQPSVNSLEILACRKTSGTGLDFRDCSFQPNVLQTNTKIPSVMVVFVCQLGYVMVPTYLVKASLDVTVKIFFR